MSTPQKPLNSGFGAASTADDVIKNIDLTGKTAIVTGGYSGIGIITAKTLARAGAKVIVPARDQAKAKESLKPYPELTLESLDLMDPSSVDAFADRFLSSGQPLHILINNAGIMAPPLVRDTRGYESQFSTNHLGHFQLTTRLWPALLKANGARVVSVSSRGHMRSPVDFEDWNFEKRGYETWTAYGQSKSANALFAVKLDELGKQHNVRAFSLHPGGIVTDLVRYMKTEDLKKAGAIDENGNPVIAPENNMKTPEQGAATNVWCATSPNSMDWAESTAKIATSRLQSQQIQRRCSVSGRGLLIRILQIASGVSARHLPGYPSRGGVKSYGHIKLNERLASASLSFFSDKKISREIFTPASKRSSVQFSLAPQIQLTISQTALRINSKCRRSLRPIDTSYGES